MSKLDSTMKKIAALLKVTEANGATFEEAMTAARLAGDLMAKYQIGMSEAEIGAEGMELRKLPMYQVPGMKIGKEFGLLSLLSVPLGKYCQVKPWREKDLVNSDNDKLCALGLKSDVELFTWLINTMAFVGWQLAVKGTSHIQGEKRIHRKGFLLGFVRGIADTVDAVIAEREKLPEQVTTDGKSLIVIKQDLQEKRLSEMGMTFTKGRKITTSAGKEFAAGRVEGRKQVLGKPLGGGNDALLLGSK